MVKLHIFLICWRVRTTTSGHEDPWNCICFAQNVSSFMWNNALYYFDSEWHNHFSSVHILTAYNRCFPEVFIRIKGLSAKKFAICWFKLLKITIIIFFSLRTFSPFRQLCFRQTLCNAAYVIPMGREQSPGKPLPSTSHPEQRGDRGSTRGCRGGTEDWL